MAPDVPESKSAWHECRPGEVGQLVDRLRTRRRRHAIARQAAVLTALCLAIGGGAFLWSTRATHPGGVTCDQVVANTAAFIHSELDRATMGKIERHLADCPHCRKYVERARREAAPPGSSRHSGPSAAPHSRAPRRMWLAATR
jgi:anti-sigma factor RsiW